MVLLLHLFYIFDKFYAGIYENIENKYSNSFDVNLIFIDLLLQERRDEKVRNYDIYLIEEEFADFFYGRESKFMELFTASPQKMGELYQIIQKQIHYITKPLPYLRLHQHISACIENNNYYIKGKVYVSSHPDGNEGAELRIEKRNLHLHSWGGYTSESIFFEVLRKFDGRFLAMDIDNNRYGWLKPLKERKILIK